MKKEYTVIPTKAHRNFAKHKMTGISQNAIDNISSSKTSLDNIVAYSKQVNTEYRMPTTLGKPKENKTVMALDSCCERNINVFREEWTRASFPAFIGYSSLALLQQEPLIRAGVEALVDDMTRKFVKIVGTGEEDLTEDIAEIESDFKKFGIKDIFNKANSLCGYQGGCLVYIDVGPVDDETSPLVIDPMTFQRDMLRGFKVIEPINVYPGKYNTTDPTSSDYYVPETWFILGKEYHKSRFLYFSQNELPMLLKPIYNFFGMSLSQQVLDYVHAFTKNREAMQRLLNKFSLTVFRTDMSRLLNGDPTCAADIKRRSEFFAKQRDNDGIALIDNTSEAMEQLNTPLAGVSDIVASSLDMLPIIFGESKDKYYGDLPKGLNASSEGTNRIYYDKILSLNEKINSKNIQKVIEILQVNRGKEVNPDISFNYIPLWEMDEKERAELNKMQADTDAIYLDRGVLAPNEVRDRLAHDDNNDYNSIDPDDVPENEFNGMEEENTDIDNIDKAGAVFDEEPDWFPEGIALDEWEENKHPSDDNGQFSNGNNETTSLGNYENNIKDLLNNIKNNSLEHKIISVGKVSHKLNEDAHKAGFNIGDYEHTIDNYGIKHAFKKHSKPETEIPRGQIPIEEDDIYKIPEITSSYDSVSFEGKDKLGNNLITYTKKMSDGLTYYVEEIRTGKRKLNTKTMYKIKG